MNFLSRLFSKNQNDIEVDILNSGLDMAMEFGENFRKPIQERLAKKYVGLTPEQLDQYNLQCTAALHAGNQFVSDLLEQLSASHQTIRESDLKMRLKSFMATHHPWANSDNLARLYGQSCYYALKNGFDQAIKS